MPKIWLGYRFLVVSFLYKASPNPRKKKFCGKKWPKWPLFNLFCLGFGLGSSSVSEYFFLCFPTQQKFVNRIDPTMAVLSNVSVRMVMSTISANRTTAVPVPYSIAWYIFLEDPSIRLAFQGCCGAAVRACADGSLSSFLSLRACFPVGIGRASD